MHSARMTGMRLDHISYAAGPDGLMGTVARLAELLGAGFVDGGVHPRFGTLNHILPLEGGQYVEVVGVLDHPASDKAPFGQAVRSRSEMGGGWLGWVIAVDDLRPIEHRLGREAVPGNRHRPDGVNLTWRQIGVKGTMADPQLPFFVQWDDNGQHPSAGARGIRLTCLEIAGDPDRVADWVGHPADHLMDDVDVRFVGPNGAPGVVAAVFETPNGEIRI
jgi:glyoxalase-like protein